MRVVTANRVAPVERQGEFARPRPAGTEALNNAVVLDGETGQPVALTLPLDDDALPKRIRAWLHRNSKLFGSTGRLSGIENPAMTFGYSVAQPLRQRYGCGLSRFDVQHQGPANALKIVADTAWSRVQTYMPEIAQDARERVSEIGRDWLMGNGIPFTSGVINRSAALPYHRDSGNVRDSWSAMIVLRKNMRGGELHLPEYATWLACRHASVCVFRGQNMLHGVTPMAKEEADGHRFSIVYYAKAGFRTAGTYAQEQARARTRATESFETPRTDRP